MSFHLSSGTLDSMAGVFSPAKKYCLGSGGGKGKPPKGGGTMLVFAVASMLPKAANSGGAYRAPAQTKRAFGGGNQTMVSRRAIATMERTARRVPEVMVRITGRQSGAGHVLANFSYISRLGHGSDKELGLHTSEGEVIRDGEEMRELAQEWHQYEMEGNARRKGATSLSMILSMPTGTDPEKVEAAALDLARTEFANRMWVASLHVDREHPHVHLTIARRDDQGRRFNPNRDDLFRYRQRFAEKLRDLGIEANATPAKARGIDPKHEHIAARKVRDKGGIPSLDKTRAERTERFRSAGRNDPVDSVLAEQRAIVRAAYERSIAELSASPSMVNQIVAKNLKRFVDALPEPEPNSIRAARDRGVERGAGTRAGAPDQVEKGAEQTDRLTAAIARLRAAREAGRAGLEKLNRLGESASDAERTRRPPDPDHSRAEPDPPDRDQTSGTADPLADILRQVEERDRAHRQLEQERDRDRDRGSPRR